MCIQELFNVHYMRDLENWQNDIKLKAIIQILIYICIDSVEYYIMNQNNIKSHI